MQNKAFKLSNNVQDSITYYYRLSTVAEFKKDFETAYRLHSKAKTMEVPEVRARLEQPILSEQIKVIEKDLELLKYKQKNNVIFALFSGVIVILFVALIIIKFRYEVKRKQSEIDDYTNLVIDLRHTINDNDSAATETIQSILQSHNYLINNIGDSLSQISENSKNHKSILKEIRSLIEKLGNDEKTLRELENNVNQCCNNVMMKVRAEVPNLSETDYRQLCYYYAGFSGKVISMLLNISLANVYMRKSRIKDKIQQSDAIDKEIILGYLS